MRLFHCSLSPSFQLFSSNFSGIPLGSCLLWSRITSDFEIFVIFDQYLWPFVVVSPLTVFCANSKLSSITLLSGLRNAPPHPAPQIWWVSR